MGIPERDDNDTPTHGGTGDRPTTPSATGDMLPTLGDWFDRMLGLHEEGYPDTDSDGTTIGTPVQGGDDTPTTPAEPPTEPPVQVAPFRFTGSGGEYFRIWIVNLFLTIITLGTYSAWAKVRTYAYFYGNTWLDGHTFAYHAKPMAILKGRTIAITCLSIYSLVSAFYPMTGVMMLLLLLALLPWLVTRSLRFNAVNSSYRNVRFDFRGKPGGAFMPVVVWPIIGLLTLFILFPVSLKKQYDYMINHYSYGTSSFTIKTGYADYYAIFFGAVFMFIITLVMSFIAILIMIVTLDITHGILLTENENIGIITTATAFALGYLSTIAFFQAAMFNIIYQGSRLDRHGFAADMTTGGYLKLIGLNLLGMILTLGLFYPFAKVRVARYMADHLNARLAGPLDNYQATAAQRVGATGGELASALDMDISL